MWRDGKLLVVGKGERFPDRCVKTNKPAHGRRVLQVAEIGTVIVSIIHLLSPIVALISAPLLLTRESYSVALSDEWHRKRRRGYIIAGIVIPIGFVALAYGTGIIGLGKAILGSLLIILGVLFTSFGILYVCDASTLITAKRITNDYVWLKGAGVEFLASLPEWPGELWAETLDSPDMSE
jgi:hypothetical protein